MTPLLLFFFFHERLGAFPAVATFHAGATQAALHRAAPLAALEAPGLAAMSVTPARAARGRTTSTRTVSGGRASRARRRSPATETE